MKSCTLFYGTLLSACLGISSTHAMEEISAAPELKESSCDALKEDTLLEFMPLFKEHKESMMRDVQEEHDAIVEFQLDGFKAYEQRCETKKYLRLLIQWLNDPEIIKESETVFNDSDYRKAFTKAHKLTRKDASVEEICATILPAWITASDILAHLPDPRRGTRGRAMRINNLLHDKCLNVLEDACGGPKEFDKLLDAACSAAYSEEFDKLSNATMDEFVEKEYVKNKQAADKPAAETSNNNSNSNS